MTEPRSIVLLMCRDEAVRCPDVLDSTRLWAARGYAVELIVQRSSKFPVPAFREPGVRVTADRTIRDRLRVPVAAVRRIIARPSAPATGAAPTGAVAGAAPRSSAPPGSGLGRWLTPFMEWLERLEFVATSAVRLILRPPRFAVAFDIEALVAAAVAHRLRRVPYAYFSRELHLSWDEVGWPAKALKRLERWAHGGARWTILQDAARAALLARDNRVEASRILILPNAPCGPVPRDERHDLRDKLAIEPGVSIVLYAGGMTSVMMAAELAESVASWPREALLVLHGVASEPYATELRRVVDRHPGRIVWSTSLVPPDELEGVYGSAAVGLAFYRPIDDNHRYVGHAAGKLFQYLKMGVPVIANDLPGMRELLEDRGCGRVVGHPGEIGDAIASLLPATAALRERCRAVFEEFEFERCFGRVADAIDADLSVA